MSVLGFQQKQNLDRKWVGGVGCIQVYFGMFLSLQSNLLHVMLNDNFNIIWTSDCYVLLVCIIMIVLSLE